MMEAPHGSILLVDDEEKILKTLARALRTAARAPGASRAYGLRPKTSNAEAAPALYMSVR